MVKVINYHNRKSIGLLISNTKSLPDNKMNSGAD